MLYSFFDWWFPCSIRELSADAGRRSVALKINKLRATANFLVRLDDGLCTSFLVPVRRLWSQHLHSRLSLMRSGLISTRGELRAESRNGAVWGQICWRENAGRRRLCELACKLSKQTLFVTMAQLSWSSFTQLDHQWILVKPSINCQPGSLKKADLHEARLAWFWGGYGRRTIVDRMWRAMNTSFTPALYEIGNSISRTESAQLNPQWAPRFCLKLQLKMFKWRAQWTAKWRANSNSSQPTIVVDVSEKSLVWLLRCVKK